MMTPAVRASQMRLNGKIGRVLAVILILSASLIEGGSRSFAAPAVSSSPSAATNSTSPAAVRAQVIASLASKVRDNLVIHVIPHGQTPVEWLNKARAGLGTEPDANFRFVGEALLLSQDLMAQKDESARRSGLIMASECANFVAAHMDSDKELLANIYRGFILPNVSLAGVQPWDSPSRQRLLEASVSAFNHAGMRDAQKSVLEWLLQIGATQKSSTRGTAPQLSGKTEVRLDVNTLDWARANLAVLLMQPSDAPRADLERAYSLLQELDISPRAGSMKGFLHLRDQLKIRLQTVVSQPTSPDPTP